jgi:DNA-binding IclR family transcriptional regulator
VQGPATVNFGTQPGTELEFHASAHGKVALAFGPTGLIEQCLARGGCVSEKVSHGSGGVVLLRATAIGGQWLA